jgi:hypothetical protein
MASGRKKTPQERPDGAAAPNPQPTPVPAAEPGAEGAGGDASGAGALVPAAGAALAPIDLVATRVERWPAGILTANPRNSRVHSRAQIQGLIAAFRTYGFTIPVLVDEDGVIIAGHGRMMAAVELGMEEVPVIVAKGWSQEKIRAYMIWDNRSAEMASWDPAMLKLEVGELAGLNLDLSLTGFTLEEVEAMQPAISTPPTPPDQFPSFGEGIVTTYCCPKCNYRWSGQAHAGK